MSRNKIRVKKLVTHASIPFRKDIENLGYDLVATDFAYNPEYGYYEYGTGIAIQPENREKVFLIPRSSIRKYPLIMCNSVGLIENSYTGELIFCFKPTQEHEEEDIYQVGDRIGQLVFDSIDVDFEEVAELNDTIRGSGGFGSSGN